MHPTPANECWKLNSKSNVTSACGWVLKIGQHVKCILRLQISTGNWTASQMWHLPANKCWELKNESSESFTCQRVKNMPASVKHAYWLGLANSIHGSSKCDVYGYAYTCTHVHILAHIYWNLQLLLLNGMERPYVCRSYFIRINSVHTSSWNWPTSILVRRVWLYVQKCTACQKCHSLTNKFGKVLL